MAASGDEDDNVQKRQRRGRRILADDDDDMSGQQQPIVSRFEAMEISDRRGVPTRLLKLKPGLLQQMQDRLRQDDAVSFDDVSTSVESKSQSMARPRLAVRGLVSLLKTVAQYKSAAAEDRDMAFSLQQRAQRARADAQEMFDRARRNILYQNESVDSLVRDGKAFEKEAVQQEKDAQAKLANSQVIDRRAQQLLATEVAALRDDATKAWNQKSEWTAHLIDASKKLATAQKTLQLADTTLAAATAASGSEKQVELIVNTAEEGVRLAREELKAAQANVLAVATVPYVDQFVQTYWTLWSEDDALDQASDEEDQRYRRDGGVPGNEATHARITADIRDREGAFHTRVQQRYDAVAQELTKANVPSAFLKQVSTKVIRQVADRDAIREFFTRVLLPSEERVETYGDDADNDESADPLMDMCGYDETAALSIDQLRMLLNDIPLYAWDTVVESNELDALKTVANGLTDQERDRLERAVSHQTVFRLIGNEKDAVKWYGQRGHETTAWTNVALDANDDTIRQQLQRNVNRHIAELQGVSALETAAEKERFREHVYAIAHAMLSGLEQLPLPTIAAWFACNRANKQVTIQGIQMLDRLIREVTSYVPTCDKTKLVDPPKLTDIPCNDKLTRGMIDFDKQGIAAKAYAEESRAAHARLSTLSDASLEVLYKVWENALRMVQDGQPAANVEQYVRQRLNERDLVRLQQSSQGNVLDVPERLAAFLLLPSYSESFVLSPSEPAAIQKERLQKWLASENQYTATTNAMQQVWQNVVATRAMPPWLRTAAMQTRERLAAGKTTSAYMPLVRALKEHGWGKLRSDFFADHGAILSPLQVQEVSRLAILPLEELVRFDPQWKQDVKLEDIRRMKQEREMGNEESSASLKRRRRGTRFLDVTVRGNRTKDRRVEATETETTTAKDARRARDRQRREKKSELVIYQTQQELAKRKKAVEEQRLKAARQKRMQAEAVQKLENERKAREIERQAQELAAATILLASSQQLQHQQQRRGGNTGYTVALQALLPPGPFARFFERVRTVRFGAGASGDEARVRTLARRKTISSRH